jgi:hypothetical protein
LAEAGMSAKHLVVAAMVAGCAHDFRHSICLGDAAGLAEVAGRRGWRYHLGHPIASLWPISAMIPAVLLRHIR